MKGVQTFGVLHAALITPLRGGGVGVSVGNVNGWLGGARAVGNSHGKSTLDGGLGKSAGDPGKCDDRRGVESLCSNVHKTPTQQAGIGSKPLLTVGMNIIARSVEHKM